ncbi:NifU family protein [Runella slithyformis]|uniref:Nitrogen-fixing NifU domain-containing protein n=1 Tax=Runella slithyformis (strain ATCC 29530 / DSM 19594 / LMG 11500 / NCIMB 11436 / LSU 4) TaxID=761193 RepID=A0A7U4E6N0_RUNSL|nr:NifU family protein [Runella slithyformis]AEI49438.1 nitrogen-fixing NifU domain-containing protein [Runella slithyformis DSM 19594]
MQPVFIYTEASPNPNSMKFVLNFELVPQGLSFDYPDIESAQAEGKASPLAGDLFQFPFVQRVFLASNFVTLTKDDATDWGDVILDTKQFLKIYFEENHPVFEQKTVDKNTAILDTDSPTIRQIKTILDDYVRPAVESDGGAISFHSFEEETGTVKVLLQGSCSGCPSSTLTLKAGIQNLLTQMVPDVKEVVAEGV